MINKISANNITWIDILKPKEDDLAKLKDEYNLHPFIAKQFIPPIHRPKIEEHPDQLFLVLHFPIYDEGKEKMETIELDFIITPDTLITTHSKKIDYLQTFFDDCKLQKYHQKQFFQKNSGTLLLALLDWLIDSCLPMLDHIGEDLELIEDQVFQGKEKEMLTEIAHAKHNLIDFRRAIKPQRSVLEILAKKAPRVFGVDCKPMTQEVVGSVIRVWNVLENHQELISSIEQTNNSLLSYKLSDIMKFLTVVSFITFPLSVVVGFFGMNVFTTIPVIGQNPNAWIWITSSMIVTTFVMVIYFRAKKWL